MLQLIVLGQIPGTHLQLTFAWFQVIVLPVAIFAGYKVYKLHSAKLHQHAQQQLDAISLQNLDQA